MDKCELRSKRKQGNLLFCDVDVKQANNSGSKVTLSLKMCEYLT